MDLVKKGFAFVACAFAGAGILACSENNSNVAGGGGSGVEAGNAITAQIFSDGKPAAFARITLTENQSLDTNIVLTNYADNEGKVTIPLMNHFVGQGDYILEASLQGKILQKEFSVPEVPTSNVELGENNLEDPVQVSGTFGYKNVEGFVKVRGLNYHTPVLNGKFSFAQLPAGNLDFVFIPTSGGVDTLSIAVTAKPGETTSIAFEDTTSKPEEPDSVETPQVVLFDDFESGSQQHRIADSLGIFGGFWVLISNGVINDPDPMSFGGRYPLDTAENGSIAVHYSVKTLVPKDSSNMDSITAWSSLGVPLGIQYQPYDLSTIDTIAFKVKGEGSLTFALLHEGKDMSIVIQQKVYLSDEWTRVAVPIKGHEQKDCGYTLSDITLLSFTTANDMDFWMDDLQFISLSDKPIYDIFKQPSAQ